MSKLVALFNHNPIGWSNFDDLLVANDCIRCLMISNKVSVKVEIKGAIRDLLFVLIFQCNLRVIVSVIDNVTNSL